MDTFGRPLYSDWKKHVSKASNPFEEPKKLYLLELDVLAFYDVFAHDILGADWLATKVQGISQSRGFTATANALRHIREKNLTYKEARLNDPDTSTHVIVVIDGMCNQGSVSKSVHGLLKTAIRSNTQTLSSYACKCTCMQGTGDITCFD